MPQKNKDNKKPKDVIPGGSSETEEITKEAACAEENQKTEGGQEGSLVDHLKNPEGKKMFPYRYPLVGLGVLCLAGGVFLLRQGLGKETITQEETLLTYEVNATSHYQVQLVENNLYEEGTLEEGLVYPDKLTDLIRVNFTSGFLADQSATVGGTYRIDAVLEGYTGGEAEQVIYRKVENLKQQDIPQSSSSKLSIDETVEVTPKMFSEFIENAENLLGAQTAKKAYLLFEGNYTVSTEGQQKSPQFSYILPIPISGVTSFFTVDKPEDMQLSENITQTSTTEKKSFNLKFLGGLVLVILGILSGLGFFFTRDPDEEERFGLAQKKVVRKQRGRIINVETLPDLSDKEVLRIAEIEDLAAISEDLKIPMMCRLSENNVPEGGRFVVISGKNAYLHEIVKKEG